MPNDPVVIIRKGSARVEDVLEEALGIRPQIVRVAGQKPYCTNIPGLDFSISHSHEYWGVAWIIGCRIGFDLQYHDPKIRTALVARNFYTPEEQQEPFFTVWTRKEAAAKCIGSSIWAMRKKPLPSFRYMDIAAPDGYTACVALDGG